MPTFRAPARITLNVRVVGNHEDGSPDIVSLNQTIDLCDFIKLDYSDQDIFINDCFMIRQVVEAFRKASNVDDPVSLEVVNNIPPQAHLGMELSQSATTLWALNQIFSHPLNEKELKELALYVHSDLSFYFSWGSAKCSGAGRKFIEEVDSVVDDPFWLVFSPFDVSEEEIFRRYCRAGLEDRKQEGNHSQMSNSQDKFFNDLEESAFALNPKLALLKERTLECGFSTVVMSGLGPTFVCMDGDLEQNSSEPIYQSHTLLRSEGEWY